MTTTPPVMEAPPTRHPEQPLQAANVHLSVDGAHNRHPIIKTIAIGTLGVLALVGAKSLSDQVGLSGWLDIPGISVGPIHLDGEPAKVEAGVLEGTQEIEDQYNINCRGLISAGVSVYGNKNEALGGGRIDKVIFGDYQPCGDNVPADIIKTVSNGKVTGIVAKTNGLEVTHPRVNFMDERNCAPTEADDSIKETRQKIKKYRHDVAAGKDVHCDSGFSKTGAVTIGGSNADVIPTGQTAAQIALAIDANPGKLITKMNEEFKADLKQSLEDRFPDARVKIVDTSAKSREAERVREVTRDLIKNGYDVSFEGGTNKNVMHVTSSAGSEVTVKLKTIDVSSVSIDSITSEVGDANTRTHRQPAHVSN